MFFTKPKWCVELMIDYEKEGWIFSKLKPSWREDWLKNFKVSEWCWLSPDRKNYIECYNTQMIRKMKLKKLNENRN